MLFFLSEPSGLALSLRGPSVTFAARTGEHTGKTNGIFFPFPLAIYPDFSVVSYFTPPTLAFHYRIGNI